MKFHKAVELTASKDDERELGIVFGDSPMSKRQMDEHLKKSEKFRKNMENCRTKGQVIDARLHFEMRRKMIEISKFLRGS